MFAFDSNQLQSLVSKLFRFALRIMSPLTAAASLKLIRADDPFIAVILCSSIKLVAAQQLQSICHAHMPVDYSKWATIVVSDSDDIDEETSSGQDGEADKSHQPQTHAAALDGRPEPAFAAEEPGREKIADMCELVELLTTGAFDNEKVDQGKLATAWMPADCFARWMRGEERTTQDSKSRSQRREVLPGHTGLARLSAHPLDPNYGKRPSWTLGGKSTGRT